MKYIVQITYVIRATAEIISRGEAEQYRVIEKIKLKSNWERQGFCIKRYIYVLGEKLEKQLKLF